MDLKKFFDKKERDIVATKEGTTFPRLEKMMELAREQGIKEQFGEGLPPVEAEPDQYITPSKLPIDIFSTKPKSDLRTPTDILMKYYLKQEHPEMLQNLKMTRDYPEEELELSKKIARELTGSKDPKKVKVNRDLIDESGNYDYEKDKVEVEDYFKPAVMAHEYLHKKYPERAEEEDPFDYENLDSQQAAKKFIDKSGKHFGKIPLKLDGDISYPADVGEPAIYYNKIKELLNRKK